MRRHQCFTARREFGQESNPDASRFLGIVLEAVLPLGIVESGLEHRVTGECQCLTARFDADDAVSRGVTAGPADQHSGCHLVIGLEGLQLAAIDEVTLVAIVTAAIGSTPSLITITSMSPTCCA